MTRVTARTNHRAEYEKVECILSKSEGFAALGSEAPTEWFQSSFQLLLGRKMKLNAFQPLKGIEFYKIELN